MIALYRVVYRALSSSSLIQSFFLSPIFFLFLVPPSNRVLLRLATLRRIHVIEEYKRNEDGRADIRYRRCPFLTLDFILS